MPSVAEDAENAEIAQLVEHNLAKVRVASSSLVFRSKKVLHVRHWKGGRVVDYSGLENRRAERHRGFESLPFRREASSESCSLFFVFKNLHQKCTKPRCYALLRVFYKSQISHTIYPIFSL